MAFAPANNVKETTTTTGAGPAFTLAGAATNYDSFSAGVGAGNTVKAMIRGQGDWVIAWCTLTNATTLTVNTVIDGSNGASVPSFAAGSKDVFPVDDVAGLIRNNPSQTGSFSPGGSTTNANQSFGLTLRSTVSGDEQLALMHSSVTHGRTAVSETEVFFGVKAITSGGNAVGGANIYALADSNTEAMRLTGYWQGAAATAPFTSNESAGINMYALRHDGANVQVALSSNEGAFAWKAADSTTGINTIIVFDREGDIHALGATTITGFDKYNDAELLRTFTKEVANPSDIIENKFDEFIEYNKETLIDLDIVPRHVPKGARPLYNYSKIQRIVVGATWQLYSDIQSLKEQINEHQAQLEVIKTSLISQKDM